MRYARYMKRAMLLLAILLLGLTACADDTAEIAELPTLIQQASFTPSASPTASDSPTATLSPTASPSATASPTQTPTFTLTHSPTPTHTFTATATPTPTPVRIRIESEVGGFVRNGPDVSFETVGNVLADAEYEVLAFEFAENGDLWYLIEVAGQQVWVSSFVAELVEGVEIAQIAAAETRPPTLTLTPTLTPTDTLTPSPTPTFPPNTHAFVSGVQGVNLRRAPGREHGINATLAPYTPLQLVGIDSTQSWYQVTTFSGQSGWVFSPLIEVLTPMQLPITWRNTPTPVPQFVPPPSTGGSGGGSGGGGGGSLPVGSRSASIFAAGQARGNQRNVFTKVGDSITAAQPFLSNFGGGGYNLGPHGYLQDTINYFGGSWAAGSEAAKVAFNAAAVLDAIWSTPGLCQANESPLACELRVKRPSVAIIMLGSVDVQLYNAASFNGYLNSVVQTCVNFGVIPVLTTFPNADGYYPNESAQFNDIIRSTAASFGVPLIDLRGPLMTLPNRGVRADGFHLSEDGDPWSFNGDENRVGVTMRNYLTLLMLDSLRRSVLGG